MEEYCKTGIVITFEYRYKWFQRQKKIVLKYKLCMHLITSISGVQSSIEKI